MVPLASDDTKDVSNIALDEDVELGRSEAGVQFFLLPKLSFPSTGRLLSLPSNALIVASKDGTVGGGDGCLSSLVIWWLKEGTGLL